MIVMMSLREHCAIITRALRENVRNLCTQFFWSSGNGQELLPPHCEDIFKGRAWTRRIRSSSCTIRHCCITHQRKDMTQSPLFAGCTSKFLPLQGDKLKDIQDTFNNVDIRFIDEKSMVVQNIFAMVSKSLLEARPHYNDKPFGNILVILLGDFNRYCIVWSCIGSSSQMPLIPSDITFASFLTRPSPSPNLCDSNEHTKQTSGPNLRAW